MAGADVYTSQGTEITRSGFIRPVVTLDSKVDIEKIEENSWHLSSAE